MKKVAVFTLLVITHAAQALDLSTIPVLGSIAHVCSASWHYLSPAQQTIAVGVAACGVVYACLADF